MNENGVFIDKVLLIIKMCDFHYSVAHTQLHAYCDAPDIVLVGNKADLERYRVVSETSARAVADKYNLPYIETSASTGQNVKRTIDMLLDMVMTRYVERVHNYNHWPLCQK